MNILSYCERASPLFVALFECHCGVFYQTVLYRATSSF